MFNLPSLDPSIQSTPVGIVCLAYLLTLALSILLVFTFDKSSRNIVHPDNFIQSILLMSLVATTLMLSVGDSLARSFGIFGALAIIRFRVRISDPREISFIFAAMAVGIACGVNSYIIAILGTVAFCTVAFILRLSPFSNTQNLLGILRFELPFDVHQIENIESILKQYCSAYSIKSYRVIMKDNGDKHLEYEYEFNLRKEYKANAFAIAIESGNQLHDIRIRFTNTQ